MTFRSVTIYGNSSTYDNTLNSAVTVYGNVCIYRNVTIYGSLRKKYFYVKKHGKLSKKSKKQRRKFHCRLIRYPRIDLHFLHQKYNFPYFLTKNIFFLTFPYMETLPCSIW